MLTVEVYGGRRVIGPVTLNFSRWSDRSVSHPGCFSSGETLSVSVEKETLWAPEPSRRFGEYEILTLLGIHPLLLRRLAYSLVPISTKSFLVSL